MPVKRFAVCEVLPLSMLYCVPSGSVIRIVPSQLPGHKASVVVIRSISNGTGSIIVKLLVAAQPLVSRTVTE